MSVSSKLLGLLGFVVTTRENGYCYLRGAWEIEGLPYGSWRCQKGPGRLGRRAKRSGRRRALALDQPTKAFVPREWPQRLLARAMWLHQGKTPAPPRVHRRPLEVQGGSTQFSGTKRAQAPPKEPQNERKVRMTAQGARRWAAQRHP